MSDMVCVMNAGRIVQMAKPQDVYDNPADLFVADFVGKTNRIAATVEADGATLRLSDGTGLPVPAGRSLRPGAATVALRPEAIDITRQADRATGAMAGTVTHRIFLGSTAEYQISVDGLGDFLVTADRRSVQDSDLVEPGERVILNFDPGKVHVFPA